MDDMNKKLDDLRSRLGLVSGKEIAPRDRSRSDAGSGAASSDVPTPSADVPTPERKGKLISGAMAAQLSARLGGGGPHPATAADDDAHDARPVPIETLLPGVIEGDEYEGFFLYRRVYPLEHRLGDIPLGAALACVGKHIALSACDESLLAFDPLATCYMDTETTGLMGGAGTVAFLVGLGYFESDQFVLEQCFLRDYDDEGPMMEYLARCLTRFTAVVSYNGKSFDMPLLRARFIQHRQRFPLEHAAHYDLVHAARRVWKRRLSDCSLGNIEREVLGLRRQGDIPGHLIPQTWLDYLDSRDARPLRPVFYHHELDILSLAALTGHLAERLAAEDEPAFRHVEDQLSVARLLFKNKDYAGAMQAVRQVLDMCRATDEVRRDGLALLARAARKNNQFEEMREAWETLHEEYPGDIEAAEELAKVYEHQHRNYSQAIAVCQTTIAAQAARAHGTHVLSDFGMSGLRGRLKRLEEKWDRLRGKQSRAEEDFFSES